MALGNRADVHEREDSLGLNELEAWQHQHCSLGMERTKGSRLHAREASDMRDEAYDLVVVPTFHNLAEDAPVRVSEPAHRGLWLLTKPGKPSWRRSRWEECLGSCC